MRVLHIISSGGMYGAEAVILNLSRTLNSSGNHSAVAVFSNTGNPNLQLYESALREGIEAHLISCSGQIDRTVGARIRELVAFTQADVVNAHGYKADLYLYFALRGARTPMVSTCHTWYDNDWRVTLYGKADRLVLRGFAEVIAVSEEVKSRLLAARVKAKNVHLVPNGIDLRPYTATVASLREELDPGRRGLLIVGLVGRLSHEKGIDLFIRAAGLVLKNLPAIRFVVVGDGQDRHVFESLIELLDLRANVSLLGSRGDMPSVYASLDVMVSASRQEGLPMAVLEGLASGRAMVATAVGEVPSVVIDGVTGILIKPEAIELLAEKIELLLLDPELRKQLGDAGRKYVAENFSAARMTAETLRVYQRAVGKGENA